MRQVVHIGPDRTTAIIGVNLDTIILHEAMTEEIVDFISLTADAGINLMGEAGSEEHILIIEIIGKRRIERVYHVRARLRTLQIRAEDIIVDSLTAVHLRECSRNSRDVE